MTYMDYTEVVAPHEYVPMRWYSGFLPSRKCKRCYMEEHYHPIYYGYVTARPIGDSRSREQMLVDRRLLNNAH